MLTPLLVLALAAAPASNGLTVVALGAQGGLVEGDLTAFLLSANGDVFIQLDAGTVVTGLQRAIEKGSIPKVPSNGTVEERAGDVLRKRIAGTLVSHPHLDHVAGLVLASPDDGNKSIYGLPSTIDALRDHVFNWTIWPNLLDEGTPPALGQYRAVRLSPGVEASLEGTGLVVTALPLSHGPGVPSTAFLVGTERATVLYCGDTGPDDVERSNRLALLWERVAPLVRGKRLAGIFLEASYPSAREDAKLYGHLTPRWLMRELRRLAEAVDPKDPLHALAGLTVVVTHAKPALVAGPKPRTTIMKELAAANDLGVKLVFPQQGERFELRAP